MASFNENKDIKVNNLKGRLIHRIKGPSVGLQNCGNTCYFNSIMQMIYSMPELVQILIDNINDYKPDVVIDNNDYAYKIISLLHSMRSNIQPIQGNLVEGHNTTFEFEGHIMSDIAPATYGNAYFNSPNGEQFDLANLVEATGELLGGIGGQQSASEFFMLIISRFLLDYFSDVTQWYHNKPDSEPRFYYEQSNDPRGYCQLIINETKHARNGHIVQKKDEQWLIDVQTVNELNNNGQKQYLDETRSINEIINSMAKYKNIETECYTIPGEILESAGTEFYTCTSFDKLGKYLILNIRLNNYIDGNYTIKPFLGEINNMLEITLPTEQMKIYELVSVILRAGDVGGGHYINYSKTSQGWFAYNDETVSFLGSEISFNKEAGDYLNPKLNETTTFNVEMLLYSERLT